MTAISFTSRLTKFPVFWNPEVSRKNRGCIHLPVFSNWRYTGRMEVIAQNSCDDDGECILMFYVNFLASWKQKGMVWLIVRDGKELDSAYLAPDAIGTKGIRHLRSTA